MTNDEYNILVWLAAKAGFSNGCEAPEVLLPRLQAAKRRDREQARTKVTEAPPAAAPPPAETCVTDAWGTRWHRLSTLVEVRGALEVVAAASIDGIATLVRWHRESVEAAWEAEATDFESADPVPVVPGGDDDVPAEPPFDPASLQCVPVGGPVAVPKVVAFPELASSVVEPGEGQPVPGDHPRLQAIADALNGVLPSIQTFVQPPCPDAQNTRRYAGALPAGVEADLLWLVGHARQLQREYDKARGECEEARAALAAQDRREKAAGETCGVSWDEHGCDWPSAVAERLSVVRQQRNEYRELLRWAKDRMVVIDGRDADWQKLAEIGVALEGESDENVLAKLRRDGWSVAVHNDYRLDGKPHTFWLLTHPSGRWAKGEGRTDAEALTQVRYYVSALAEKAEDPRSAHEVFSNTENTKETTGIAHGEVRWWKVGDNPPAVLIEGSPITADDLERIAAWLRQEDRRHDR